MPNKDLQSNDAPTSPSIPESFKVNWADFAVEATGPKGILAAVIIVIMIVIYTIAPHYLRNRRAKLKKERDLSKRFLRCSELLGSSREMTEKDGSKSVVPNLEARQGAILDLQAIAENFDEQRPRVISILCDYIRDNASWNEQKQHETDQALKCHTSAWVEAVRNNKRQELKASFPSWLPRTDIQSILTILSQKGFVPEITDDASRLNIHSSDLRRIHLPGAVLNRANLNFAHLEFAHLSGAELDCASLRGAWLYRADLTDSILRNADLHEAHLEGAFLWGAHLEGARLTDAFLYGTALYGAHLEGADLRGAKITQDQLDVASGDSETLLPPCDPNGYPVHHPSHWLEQQSPE